MNSQCHVQSKYLNRLFSFHTFVRIINTPVKWKPVIICSEVHHVFWHLCLAGMGNKDCLVKVIPYSWVPPGVQVRGLNTVIASDICWNPVCEVLCSLLDNSYFKSCLLHLSSPSICYISALYQTALDLVAKKWYSPDCFIVCVGFSIESPLLENLWLILQSSWER